MVNQRSGDDVDIIDSSLRTVGGTVISTSLYVVSATVYAATTGPEVAGSAIFVILFMSLVTRPVRGISQTLQKIGSEKTERVAPYFSITVTFAFVYLIALSVVLFLFIGVISSYTPLEDSILTVALLISLSSVLGYISSGLVGAVGYPSYLTWITGLKDAFTMGVLVFIPRLVNTVPELLLLIASMRIIVWVPTILYFGVIPEIPSRRNLNRAYAYAVWSVPDQILDRFSYNMPTFVLGVVATPFAVGVYEAADRFADFGATICWRLSSVFLTKVSGDWSAGDDELVYLDSAITGGIGATFAVLGYLIPTRGAIAELAFPEAQSVFAITVIIVGFVNILRGFWTIVSHIMEGVNKPSISSKTKVLGLVFSVPVTAYLGLKLGAVAGAIGYATMNVVIFVYVLWYSYTEFDRLLIDWKVLASLVTSLLVSTIVARIVILVLPDFTPLISLVVGIGLSLALFATTLYAVSKSSREVLSRAYQIYIVEKVSYLRSD